MTKYSLSTIKRKACIAGFKVEKGFRHYMYGDCPVWTDMHGNRTSGYSIFDLSRNQYTPESYDNLFDNILSLEDVEKFIMSVYDNAGMEY